MDLLHFKERVNDPYDFAVGDRVLAVIGQRLQDGLATRRVFRYGGDEFLIEVTESLDEATTAALAEHIATLVGAPIEGIAKPPDVRIGFSRDRFDGDVIALVIQANRAWFRASQRDVLYLTWSPELDSA